MKKNLSTDILGTYGNVTVQIRNKKNYILKEKTVHNQVTDEGVANLLRVLCLNRTSYISAIGITCKPSGSLSEVTEDIKFTSFSSIRVVIGTQLYAEFKFYLSSDQLNGYDLISAKLYKRDGSGNEIVFAEVDTTDKIEDDTPVIEDIIPKTEDVSVLYIWRIGITSHFVQIIS